MSAGIGHHGRCESLLMGSQFGSRNRPSFPSAGLVDSAMALAARHNVMPG